MNRIPSTPKFPGSPRSQAMLLMWAQNIQQILHDLFTDLAKAVNTFMMSDTLATRPAATGSQRFYFSSDGKILYFDDGTWRVPRLETVATADLPAAAAAQNGRLIIEDAGAGDRNLVLYAQGQRFRLDGGAAF